VSALTIVIVSFNARGDLTRCLDSLRAAPPAIPHEIVVVDNASTDGSAEAAAATAVGMDTGGCTGPVALKERTLRFDRPFVFFIRDQQTGAILFMGRVLDPSKR